MSKYLQKPDSHSRGSISQSLQIPSSSSRSSFSQVGTPTPNVDLREIAKSEAENKQPAMTNASAQSVLKTILCCNVTAEQETNQPKNSENIAEIKQPKEGLSPTGKTVQWKDEEANPSSPKQQVKEKKPDTSELDYAITNRDIPAIRMCLNNPKLFIEIYHCFYAIQLHIEDEILTQLLGRFFAQKHIRKQVKDLESEYVDRVYVLCKEVIKQDLTPSILLTILDHARIKSEGLFEKLITKIVQKSIKSNKPSYIEEIAMHECVLKDEKLTSKVLEILKNKKVSIKFNALITKIEEHKELEIEHKKEILSNHVATGSGLSISLVDLNAQPSGKDEQVVVAVTGDHIPDNTL